MTPTKPGFYWAKLIRPVNMPPNEDWASLAFEPVEVYDNATDNRDPNPLRVFVLGLKETQPLDAFSWGPPLSLVGRPK